MLALLKNHPFAVESYFDTSLVLTYAAPKETLSHLIPPCVALDTFQDRWAFLAVAMVSTKHLRPKGFPRSFGNDFILTGYRIFVRYTTSTGKRLRGLFVLRSETDKMKMVFLGNLFTHYHYVQTDIAFNSSERNLSVFSKKSKIDVWARKTDSSSSLPEHSPFSTWKEARRFAGPLPFTFTYQKEKKEVLIIEGVRENWTPGPVEVMRNQVGFISALGVSDLKLASAFVIKDITYMWKKGKADPWKSE